MARRPSAAPAARPAGLRAIAVREEEEEEVRASLAFMEHFGVLGWIYYQRAQGFFSK